MNLLRLITHPLKVTITETSGADRRTYKHRALDLPDALEWAACYPRGTFVTIRTRTGKVIAYRGTP